MNKFLYPKLAWMNIKKNKQTYMPYILTCIGTMMMFYVMHAISLNDGLLNMPNSMSLQSILSMGVVVILIFSVIFLLYTNSFLIKRRKKELGLFNVLGMEKKHIAWVLFFETLFTSLISLAFGLFGGIILNKLMFVLLLRLLKFDIPLGFELDMASIEFTAQCFSLIFILTLICNLVQIWMSKPIELLKGGQVGEKEPKTKWISAIIGVLSLGIGYGIALSVETPLAAIPLFLVAVIFVMIGTYELFTAGSIVVLKLLRKNKKIYYKKHNFIAISGMMYRMKQNAKGLANICILSTAVIVMLSTTVSLYVGMEESLHTQYPQDVFLRGNDVNDEKINRINQILDDKVNEYQIKLKDEFHYKSKSMMATLKDGNYALGQNISSDSYSFGFISIDDFNRLEQTDIQLSVDEVLIFSISGTYGKDSIMINNQVYQIKQEFDEVSFQPKQENSLFPVYLLIVNDIQIFGEEDVYYSVGFNVDNTDEVSVEFVDSLNTEFRLNSIDAYVSGAASSRADFLMSYGGLFFLGIFLGTLFLMATVLIIYYKQVSEGYDDKERFEIMQRVGMSKQEIRKTIRVQILMVFFLPLIFMMIHIAFAFPIITKLLALFGLMNTQLFLAATIGTIVIFASIYALIFNLTAKTYYKIVE
ncbi:FtsX-like permease family protein [Turicibacter sanguinis]|jgi:efflux ABC transporter, permease protein|uniref:FtsX-like permease family protein n=1 Tax=Turicibacter sanguinis TaxID=154288 RepID=UPI0006C336BB|nr:FtsX-like permease family protein [Turicibacter sanguinis]MCU7212328.1 FtsX-like permease family protein [Turicibacter sanguinis]MDB8545726.1 FtsX-like permease family protein [Turicibacter sanguinis]MDB8554820.1 FtsX-like permease family protein [Turicibacter sanguinis]MDB8575306.1 FtsX-like permease family protein [Turicibacter sanguinis]MDB8577367.1 FtsX-like permease family protein [Turicibacter sanguinis]